MTSIPANELVQVLPSVLGAGGSAQSILGLCLTDDTRAPIGSVLSFPDKDSVSDYFGSSSAMARKGAVYFNGFDNASARPSSLLVSQFNTAAVAAYLRGGSLADMTLAELQALSGTLNVTINGVLKTASINLSASTSFSNAAEIIGAALGIQGVQVASVTGSVGGTFTGTSTGTTLTVAAVLTGSLQVGDTVTANDGTNSLPAATTILSQLSGSTGGTGTYQLSAAATPGNLTSTTVTAVSSKLKVTAVSSGALDVADVVTGTSVPANTYIASLQSGTTGGVGIYNLSGAQFRVASEAITGFGPGVTFDSVAEAFVVNSSTTGAASTIGYGSGALGLSLLLDAADGAVTSQGANAVSSTTASTFMDALLSTNSTWATFFLTFDPDAGSGFAIKEALAAWNDAQDQAFAYIAVDTDVGPTETKPDPSCFVAALQSANNSGTIAIWADTYDRDYDAFAAGAFASVDFTETNGRITLAYKRQAGLVASVATAVVATNLAGNPQTADDRGNGYNLYGAYASANTNFVWFQRGFVTGDFKWADSYVDEIWLNRSMQGAILAFLGSVKSVPYGPAGNSLIEQALAPVISAGLNFGAYGPGDIDQSQIAAVNASAGANIAGTLQTQGWFLQIKPASSTTRAARTSPPMKFWYLDRGSIQAISLDSIAVQ